MPAGEHTLPELRAALLDLLRGNAADVPPLSSADWVTLDRLAAVHRVQPLLHHYHGGDPAIPAAVRDGWRAAFRQSALRALQLSGELARTTALLTDAGYAPIALKGAWLAWHAYPHPALRPMRDLDLLLAPETVLDAYRVLRAHGYVQLTPGDLPLEDSVRLDKHMPPLLSPRGVVVELHQRLWEANGRMDHAAPRPDEAAVRARAITVGGTRFLAPQDLLAHLIIHAVYDHRLDCGPLVLPDIAFLARRAPIDWAALRAEAQRGNWARGADLVLELLRRHDPDLPIPPASGTADMPPDFVPLAADLLLQDLATRRSAGVLATLAAAGPAAFVRRIFARRAVPGRAPAVQRELAHEGGYGRWATTRLARTLRHLARGDVRRQSHRLATLSRWLDS